MQAQGIWELVEHIDPKNVVETKMDNMALVAIYQGIPEDILMSIAEKKITKTACEAIKLMCMGAERVKTGNVQTLKAELESMNMKECDQLEDFFMRMTGICDIYSHFGRDNGRIICGKETATSNAFQIFANRLEDRTIR